ncbi:hypothetical protein G9A89_023980 [Geosiphon pyriformis]|nr:hypothetical protein G9A89_023980 [Geosiphon pyriformis]
MFISEESMIKTTSLASEKEININCDLKKQGVCSDQAVVIKKIPMDMPKKIIIATVFEFGNIKLIKIQLIKLWQKTVVEFAELEQTKQLALRWSFIIGKDLVCVAMAVEDQDTWMSRDCFRALLFTLLVGTTAHNLGTLLNGAGGKTCIINHSLETGNWTHCAIVGFESENKLESAFCIEPIFGDMRLSWARLDLVQCKKCRKFGHLVLKCDASDTLVSVSSKKTVKKNVSDVNRLQLAKLYARKNVPISCPAVFGGKSWAQVVFSAISSGDFWFESGSGSGSFSSSASGLSSGSLLVLSSDLLLNTCLSSLECSLKFLGDQVSGIIHKLSGMELVSLAPPSPSGRLAALVNVNLDLNSDMVLNSSVVLPVSLSVVSALGISSSKILTTKVGCLESKLVALEASISSVLVKLDQLCAGSGFWMSSASQ